MGGTRYKYPETGGFPAPGGDRNLLEEFDSSGLELPDDEKFRATEKASTPELHLSDGDPEEPGVATGGYGKDLVVSTGGHTRVFSDETALPGGTGIVNYERTALAFNGVEALRGSHADSREKMAAALRQVLHEVETGDFPWELLRPDYEEEKRLEERSVGPVPMEGQREIRLRRAVHVGSFEGGGLGEALVGGRGLVTCQDWIFWILFFLALDCLAMIADQGLHSAGILTHFLDSKAWIFIKLGLVFAAALTALRGLFYTLFGKPEAVEESKKQDTDRE